MKKLLSVILSITILLSMPTLAFAEREFVGETVIKDDMLFINGVSIPAAQLPNEFVYLRVNDLDSYGFDVTYEETDESKKYTVTRNDNEGIFHHDVTEKTLKVYSTNAKVYIDSDSPANVYELEDGTVLVQSDELAKYGTYDWNAETHTISINLKSGKELPSYMTFQQALGIDNIDTIKYGVIVNNTTKKCADIEYEDLRKWLEVYWNFNYDRVVAPMGAYTLDEEYIKLWNEDKSKSYTVYPNSGVIVGKYGEPCESRGEIKQNYVWYLPYVGNARNALNTANNNLKYTYITQADYYKGAEYKEGYQRVFTSGDDIIMPNENVLITESASSWAVPEIEKAAACNLMVYELSSKYSKPITRLEFSRLVYRLVATEFEPNSDSRLGLWNSIENVMLERGITNKVTFSDCSFSEVESLASMGIIEGMGDGTFAPDEFISREQAATLLYRTAEFLGNKTMPTATYDTNYNDENLISDWALSGVASMKAMGIMQGISETEFAPKANYTVEQAIATMLRLYECY